MANNEEVKHSRHCGIHEGFHCTCKPEYIEKFMEELRKNVENGTFENGIDK